MKKYHSIQSIKYLYYISSILGIAPFFNFKSNKYCTSIIHAGYSVTWCILEIGFTLYDVIGRISHSYVDLNVPAIFMDVLSLFLQTVTMVYLTIHLTLYRKNKFQMLIEDLNDFDKKCCNMQLDERPNKIFYLKVFIYHLIFVLFCASDAYMWNKRLGFRVLRYYISRYVQVYKFVTFAFLFYNYVLIINDRFVYLNDTLVKYVTLSNNSYLIHDCTQETMVNNAEEDSIKKFNCLYTSMYDTVNLFNEVFGCIILLMCITIVVGLLQPINIAFSYAKTDLNSQRKSMDSDLIVVCILWALLYLVNIYAISFNLVFLCEILQQFRLFIIFFLL